jgi:hypothetical protein
MQKLNIIKTEENLTYVKVPYDYKDAFKKKFKGKVSWNGSMKCWIVKNAEEEVEKYVEMKNKRITKGTATTNSSKKRTYRAYSDKENFEDFCADFGYEYLLDGRESEAWKLYNNWKGE